MKLLSLTNDIKRLIAEYLTDIAVAWFAAGVIGIFISETKDTSQIAFSIFWGTMLSLVFLWAAILVTMSYRRSQQ